MTSPISQRVLLCADDYALNAGVSEGIVALARAQRLSATSAMVLSPRWQSDAPALRELRGHLDVGVHLDWTSDFAQHAGHGLSLASLMWRSVRGALPAATVRTALERQLDAFEQHWQAVPDHVDGHQHVQQFDGLREVLTEVLQRRYGGLAQRPWLRISRVAQSDLKSRVITWMGASALTQWAQQQNWPVASPLLGAYGFDADAAAYGRRMQAWLQQLAHCAEAAQPTITQPPIIMCHPALRAHSDDAIGNARVQEYSYLMSAEFPWHCQRLGVQLCRGSQPPHNVNAPLG